MCRRTAKVVRCNWKVAMEAFAEGYHVLATHPQGVAYVMDPGSQIDVYGNFARQISPSECGQGAPAPVGGVHEASSERCHARASRSRTSRPDARRRCARGGPALGDRMRAVATPTATTSTTRFPEHPSWGGINRIVYRFRPNGETTRAHLRTPSSPSRGASAPATLRQLGPGVADAPELGPRMLLTRTPSTWGGAARAEDPPPGRVRCRWTRGCPLARIYSTRAGARVTGDPPFTPGALRASRWTAWRGAEHPWPPGVGSSTGIEQ